MEQRVAWMESMLDMTIECYEAHREELEKVYGKLYRLHRASGCIHFAPAEAETILRSIADVLENALKLPPYDGDDIRSGDSSLPQVQEEPPAMYSSGVGGSPPPSSHTGSLLPAGDAASSELRTPIEMPKRGAHTNSVFGTPYSEAASTPPPAPAAAAGAGRLVPSQRSEQSKVSVARGGVDSDGFRNSSENMPPSDWKSTRSSGGPAWAAAAAPAAAIHNSTNGSRTPTPAPTTASNPRQPAAAARMDTGTVRSSMTASARESGPGCNAPAAYPTADDEVMYVDVDNEAKSIKSIKNPSRGYDYGAAGREYVGGSACRGDGSGPASRMKTPVTANITGTATATGTGTNTPKQFAPAVSLSPNPSQRSHPSTANANVSTNVENVSSAASSTRHKGTPPPPANLPTARNMTPSNASDCEASSTGNGKGDRDGDGGVHTDNENNNGPAPARVASSAASGCQSRPVTQRSTPASQALYAASEEASRHPPSQTPLSAYKASVDSQPLCANHEDGVRRPPTQATELPTTSLTASQRSRDAPQPAASSALAASRRSEREAAPLTSWPAPCTGSVRSSIHGSQPPSSASSIVGSRHRDAQHDPDLRDPSHSVDAEERKSLTRRSGTVADDVQPNSGSVRNSRSSSSRTPSLADQFRHYRGNGQPARPAGSVEDPTYNPYARPASTAGAGVTVPAVKGTASTASSSVRGAPGGEPTASLAENFPAYRESASESSSQQSQSSSILDFSPPTGSKDRSTSISGHPKPSSSLQQQQQQPGSSSKATPPGVKSASASSGPHTPAITPANGSGTGNSPAAASARADGMVESVAPRRRCDDSIEGTTSRGHSGSPIPNGNQHFAHASMSASRGDGQQQQNRHPSHVPPPPNERGGNRPLRTAEARRNGTVDGNSSRQIEKLVYERCITPRRDARPPVLKDAPAVDAFMDLENARLRERSSRERKEIAEAPGCMTDAQRKRMRAIKEGFDTANSGTDTRALVTVGPNGALVPAANGKAKRADPKVTAAEEQLIRERQVLQNQLEKMQHEWSITTARMKETGNEARYKQLQNRMKRVHNDIERVERELNVVRALEAKRAAGY